MFLGKTPYPCELIFMLLTPCIFIVLIKSTNSITFFVTLSFALKTFEIRST